MKHIFCLIFAFLGLVSWSQAPLSIPYQAVVRNADGSVMANAALTMTFKIHDVAATGNVVYQETHSLSSNAQGLVVCAVGSGTAEQGTFAGIQWGSGAKFMHVLMNAGSGEIDLGTQQMMSVPYALYAVQSGTTGPVGPVGPVGPQGPQGPPGNGVGFNHWVGEYYGGGVVFHVFKDAFGEEHGLIVSIQDLGEPGPYCYCLTAFWGLSGVLVYDSYSLWDGMANTQSILTYEPEPGSAALICDSYESEGFSDWYLPSINELYIMLSSLYTLNYSLSQIPNGQIFTTNGTFISSTQNDATNVWGMTTTFLRTNINKSDNTQRLRAIRRF